MKIFNFLKDIFAPKKCYSCFEEGHFLCKDCFKKLNNFSSICYVCKEKSKNFEIHKQCRQKNYYDKLIVLTHYDNKIIKKIIKDFKYYGKKDVLDEIIMYLVKILLKNLKNFKEEDFLIIPTPMYFFKKIKRGYNQSEIISKKISKEIGVKYENKLVKKIKGTKQQSLLTKEKRLINLKNCFKINKKLQKKYKNKTIIIVDDVVSTGTTINEISKILKENGFQKIIGLAIASD